MQTLSPLKIQGRKLTRAETTHRFYQPSGRTNQIVGIQADFTVPFKPDATEDERFVLREAEKHPTALPPLGAEWTSNRPEDVKRIQTCIDKNQRALKKYQEIKTNNVNEDVIDYQLYAAQEVLACDEETSGFIEN